jgi:DNA-binding GntR family transcriptional regulator
VTEAPVAVGRDTLVDLAARALRDELQSGRLQAGSRIHLGETAARLGMSPIPVREALRTLATEGLVVSLPHRGYRVPEANLADLEDTYRLRLILDPLAVELAVPNLTPEHVARAEAALARLEAALKAGEWAEIRAANRDFHLAFYEASGSPWLLKLISMLWESSERYQRLSAPYRGTTAQRKAEHVAILEACRSGKARRAAELMHEHLNRTYTMARKALGAADG